MRNNLEIIHIYTFMLILDTNVKVSKTIQNNTKNIAYNIMHMLSTSCSSCTINSGFDWAFKIKYLQIYVFLLNKICLTQISIDISLIRICSSPLSLFCFHFCLFAHLLVCNISELYRKEAIYRIFILCRPNRFQTKQSGH